MLIFKNLKVFRQFSAAFGIFQGTPSILDSYLFEFSRLANIQDSCVVYDWALMS